MDGVELIGTVDPAHPLVVVALEQEARHFVTDFPVLVTGVGKVRAALAVAHALAGGARPDFDPLRRSLRDEVPTASLDDHGLWLSRLSTMADTVIAIGIVLVALVLVTLSFREGEDGPVTSAQNAAAAALRPFQVAADRIARMLDRPQLDDDDLRQDGRHGVFLGVLRLSAPGPPDARG